MQSSLSEADLSSSSVKKKKKEDIYSSWTNYNLWNREKQARHRIILRGQYDNYI